jgi:hypothetical protein
VTSDPGVRRVKRDARHALIAGLVVVVGYAALAAWSGSLSPLARGPLLDGVAPVNYRWVSPPPELDSSNQEPSSGQFELPLREGAVGTQVLFTADSQVTVVIDEGSIGAPATQRSVELVLEPVDPAELAPPGGDLAVFGNAYRVNATALPSRDRIGEFERPIQAILVYPATSTLHANIHELLFSPDGATWESLETTDSPGQQQATADLPGPGYVVVAGVPAQISPSPSEAGSGGASGTPPLAVALLVAAGVVLVVGLGLLIRSRGR